jgi:AraC-like DNA-binding protein
MQRIAQSYQAETMTNLDRLQRSIMRHAQALQVTTAIPGLTLYRADEPSAHTMPVLYTPMVCLIAQGVKHVVVGTEELTYDDSKYLIASVDLPATSTIRKASVRKPYLSLSLELQPALLAEILLSLPVAPAPSSPPRGLAVAAQDPRLVEAFARLLRLLDTPAEIPSLAPLLVHEIHYRLLTGAHTVALRQLCLQESHTAQVSRAVAWIRKNYARPFRMDALARTASMSTASLHRHFKAVTAMSPLQYQKQVRLQEARRLLITEHEDAAAVAFTVGYGSPSQFSREYHRHFGAPPRQDAERIRSAELVSA